MSLEPLNISFSYSLIRSKRKTVSISIDPVRGIVVKAPTNYKESSLLELLKKHEQKIINLLRKNEIVSKAFEDEGKFMYLGEMRPMIHSDSSQLEAWLVEEASKVILGRIKAISARIGVYPQKVSLRSQKTRWGSCSSKGNISLNWKLIFAPIEVIDYVIIHELCHLQQMNHSNAFWTLVSSYAPHYKEQREWLKKHSHLIHWPYNKS